MFPIFVSKFSHFNYLIDISRVIPKRSFIEFVAPLQKTIHQKWRLRQNPPEEFLNYLCFQFLSLRVLALQLSVHVLLEFFHVEKFERLLGLQKAVRQLQDIVGYLKKRRKCLKIFMDEDRLYKCLYFITLRFIL